MKASAGSISSVARSAHALTLCMALFWPHWALTSLAISDEEAVRMSYGSVTSVTLGYVTHDGD